jgi:hypothetical protein
MSAMKKILGTAAVVGGGLLALKSMNPQAFAGLMGQFKTALLQTTPHVDKALRAASAKGTQALGNLHATNPRQYQTIIKAAETLKIRPEDFIKLADRLPKLSKSKELVLASTHASKKSKSLVVPDKA